VAILIDALVFLLVIVPLISSTHGSTAASGFYAGFSINEHSYYLSGLPLLIGLFAWLAYMTVCEATVGASLGKVVLGIRVHQDGGAGVGFVAATIRNLLRFVDFLPLLYLLGGIVAAVSERSQRIGDHVAGTMVLRKGAETMSVLLPPVVPPPPASVTATEVAILPPVPPTPASARPTRRSGLVIGLLAVTLVVIAYTAFDRTPAGVFRSHGIAFDYPTTWRTLPLKVAYEAGDPPIFRGSVGLDASDAVSVAGYALRYHIDESNVSSVQAQLGDAVPAMVASLQGTVESELSRTTIAGVPALALTVAYPSPLGSVTERETFLFSGMTEYEISCAWTGAHADEIRAGCDRALGTVHFG
jgi:uncharacterized RDD family membrane protein YckC